MPRMPPLNPVRTFEAAARLGGVNKAAEELCVTPGAVSRQILSLEEHFGTKLFVKEGRSLVLTEIGRSYFGKITRAFHILRTASNETFASAAIAPIRLRSYTTFAIRWLIPQLSSFQVDHPEIEVKLETTSDWSDFTDFDAAIGLGDGNWEGCAAERLVPNILVPVCSPTLLQERRRLSNEELCRLPILDTSARPDDWNIWLDRAGIERSLMHSRRYFRSSSLTYQAAAEGLGIALAQKVLVDQDIDAGRLAIASDLTVDRGTYTYYFVYRVEDAARPGFRALAKWLTSDTSASHLTNGNS